MPLVPDHGPAVWWAVTKRVFHQIDEKRLMLIAAGIAFFGILALFPAIAAVIALWGIVGDPQAVLPEIERYRLVMPEDVFVILSDQITTLTNADQDTLGWATMFSILLAIWSARAGVAALMQGMNAVYDERNRRGVKHYLAALSLTLALVFVALIAISAILITPAIMALVPLGPAAEISVNIARWLVALGVLLAGAGLVYRYGPNRRVARLPWITPGAIMAVMLWAGASVGFSIYLSNFGSYNEVYGSIGAVIALLMWLFITGFLLLLGAALNAELERHTKPDTTAGKPRPLGERGATVADTYVDV
ncbi:YihY/virulence factor BrkB family protein [Pseudophaeobacter sp.]|uniref:YihY/virulence factor BrkB family protein n=1 Tax=Pseudophaeobacter sp. TaxID=1971739 RepID=UPI002635A163|nr:YihY/virulence factor BrkB family protein [Pseudophaeobacter sp.]